MIFNCKVFKFMTFASHLQLQLFKIIMQQLNKAKEMINIELKYLESKYDDNVQCYRGKK